MLCRCFDEISKTFENLNVHVCEKKCLPKLSKNRILYKHSKQRGLPLITGIIKLQKDLREKLELLKERSYSLTESKLLKSINKSLDDVLQAVGTESILKSQTLPSTKKPKRTLSLSLRRKKKKITQAGMIQAYNI